MKNSIYKAVAIIAISLFFTACSSDDSDTVTGTGAITLEFDNSFGDDDLILETQENTTDSGEVLKISSIKYIISNIVLTADDGTTYTVPKSDSYFIVNEAEESSQYIDLSDVPAANYTQVTFGIGVDEDQYNAGADGQGDFLATAETEDMLWSWSSGYKFVAYEGTFTSTTVTTSTSFKVHTGQTGTDYNYTTVTLDMPTDALVRTTITPTVHIIADLSKILNSTNVIKLSDYNTNGTGANIMGGTALPLITENVSTMFTVNHVHND